VTWLALAALVGVIASGLRVIHRRFHQQARATTGVRRWIPSACLAASTLALIAIMLASADAMRMMAKLAMPIGLIWMGLGALAAWCWMSRRQAIAALVTVMFCAYSLAGSNPLGAAAISSLETRVPMGDALALEPFEAVCVLGGGSVRRPDGVPEIGEEGDRILLAASLYLNHRTPCLVASGDFAADTVWIWGRLGIPASATLVLPAPRNTGDEIAAYARLIGERGWKRVGLVSSAWHLPRALRLCARRGIILEALPCNWLGGAPQWSGLELVPQLEGFYKSHRAAWEYLGMWMGH
jgi:uncharacterized SAM-binding protein YcdF (DUF218 family)